MRVWRMSSVAYIRPKSRTERPRKTKIGTEVGHVTRDSDTIFNINRSEVNLQGAGAYWGGLPHSLLCAKIKATYLLSLRSPKTSRYPAPLPVWYGRTDVCILGGSTWQTTDRRAGACRGAQLSVFEGGDARTRPEPAGWADPSRPESLNSLIFTVGSRPSHPPEKLPLAERHSYTSRTVAQIQVDWLPSSQQACYLLSSVDVAIDLFRVELNRVLRLRLKGNCQQLVAKP